MKNLNKVLIAGLLISSLPAAAEDLSCKSILQDLQQTENLEHMGQSAVVLELRSAFKFGGHIKLIDLGQEALVKPARAVYESRIKDLILRDHPEVGYQNGDMILALDIRGEKLGVVRNLALRVIARQSMDMIGLEPILMSYRPTPESKGSPRLIFVIKSEVKDYSGATLSDGSSIESREDARDWLADQLDNLYSDYFSESTLDIDSNFDKIYSLMARRKDVSADSPRAYISKTEFGSVYRRALEIFMTRLSGEDLLYIRKSFWDDKPVADEFASLMYTLLKQEGSAAGFIDGFGERALELRKRLYAQIHRSSGGPTSSASDAVRAEVDATVSTGGLSRGGGQEIHALTGEGSQIDFGSDFFTGPSHQNMELEDIVTQLDSAGKTAAEKLERHGISELTDLNGRDADALIKDTNISLNELISLAQALTDHGVFFRYPANIYYKIPADIRVIIKSPKGSDFGYSTRTNTYKPR